MNQRISEMLATTRGRIIAGVVALVVVCACCGAGLAAIRGGGSTTPGGSQANASSATNTPHGPTATPTQPPTPTATPKPKTWQTVQDYTGSANQQTATIHVPDGSRIVWKASASDQYGGNFAVTMYNSDNTYNDLVANTSTPPDQTGTYNVHSDLDVYFKIDTYGCNWDIQVQEYK